MKFNQNKIRRIFIEAGFTITEMAIVIVVSGILMSAAVPFFKINVDSYVQVRSGKNIIQSGRVAFNRMMAELHRIEDPLNIWIGDASQIEFYLGLRKIVYELYGDVIYRNDERFIENVQSFNLTYYREDGVTKATPFSSDSDVWRLGIVLVIGDGTSNFTLTGQISPRNLHYN